MFEDRKLPTHPFSFDRSLNRRAFAVAGALGLIMLAGCGESRLPVFPVSGKVTFQGKPAAGAQIILHPEGASSFPADLAISATVADDGTFKISSYEAADGAPAGQYVATIQWFKMVTSEGGTGRGPNVIPAKYSSATSSPLKVTVQGPSSELPPWDVTN